MSIRGISIGATGLLAAQRAAETAAHNTANANTDGYTRQRVNLTALSAYYQGGVEVASLDRLRDTMADMAWRTEAATDGFATQRSAVLVRLEDSLGQFGAGLTQALDDFYAAYDSLALRPQDTGAREAALSAAERVATEFNRTYSSTVTQVDEALAQANDKVRAANSLAAQVASLNGAIQQNAASGADTADLQDKRDLAIDKLAQLVGATSHLDTNGLLEVRIGGMPIVTGTTPKPLQISGTGLPGDPYVLERVDGARLDRQTGQVGGLLTAINVDIPAARSRLDDAALALLDAANAVHMAGYDLNGLAGMELFTGFGAADIQVNSAMTADSLAASVSGAPGDGNNALALAQLRDPADPTGAPAVLRVFISHLGAQVDNSNKDAANAQAVLSGLTDRRLAMNGVNTDEEMVDLVRFQRAYQAAAKTVQVADDMLDTIINRMGL